MMQISKEELRIALEYLIFRDGAENIHMDNCVNQDVLIIASHFNIPIKKQLTIKERDNNITKFRKLFKHDRKANWEA
jgi:hypothetical protein